MKVEVEKINDEGIEVKESFPASDWNMDSLDIKFVEDISLDSKFRRIGREILVNTEVTTRRVIVCSRCLEEIKEVIKQDFELSYEIAESGEYLEIDDDLREEVLLNFPVKVLCKPDCKGICTGCGVNLNLENCKCG